MSVETASPPSRRSTGSLILWSIGLLVAITCVSRGVWLGSKLPHHDEMVHQWLSERLAFEASYEASPAYHGPLLYHLEAGVMRVAGSGLWQARLVPALAGIGAVLALLALAAKEADARTALTVGVLAALSPSWLYYSRFDGHDTLILSMTTAVAWGRWHWSRGRTGTATWLIVIALSLAWCTKLNALFIAGAIALWPVVRWLMARAVRRDEPRPWAALRWPQPDTVAMAGGATLVVIGALFATTFRGQLADGTVLEAISATTRAATTDPVVYWAGLNHTQRLPGPFHYYVALLALYEPLLVLGVGLAMVAAWRDGRHGGRTLVLAIVTGAALGAALWPVATWTAERLHLQPVHAAVLPLCAVAVWRLARQRTREGDEAGLWWIWLAVTQTLLYSYAGEKVPWLAVHVALPWMMVAGPAVRRAWDRGGTLVRGATVASTLLTAYGAFAVVAWTANDPAEPLVQLEYAPDTHLILRGLVSTCPSVAPVEGRCLETTEDAAWPAQWYLRGLAHDAVGTDGVVASRQTPFLFLPARRASEAARATNLTVTHHPHPARFAMWGTWVDWLERPRPDDLVQFWWRRRSLGPRRGVPYELWVRRDLYVPWAVPLGRNGQDDEPRP